jgi:site-specific DNA recombinase
VKLRCACYARFSTEKQSPVSIEDQLRKCGEFATAKGWAVVKDYIYTDAAISGAGNDREGLTNLILTAKIKPRPFDVILVDDTSRLSRNVGFGARIREEMQFIGVRIVAVSQGIDSDDEQSDVLFQVHAIADTLYIKELGKKTHRGLEGCAIRGLHTGGRCFGYRNVRHENGVTLEVAPAEAEVVRRIFDLAASGNSLKAIAKLLNAESVPPPRPRAGRLRPTWCPTAIHAMLRRELYVGRMVWNKSRFLKAPGTNKRIRRPRPKVEWKSISRPELAIVGQDLWERVQSRLAWTKRVFGRRGRDGLLDRTASSPHLFSGIVKCAICDGNLVITSGRSKRGHRRYGCSNHFYRGVCSNGLQVRKETLEDELLSGLQKAVLTQDAIEYAVSAFKRQLESASQTTSRDVLRAQIERHKIQSELERLVDAVANSGHSESLLQAIDAREDRIREIDELLKTPGDNFPDQSPNRIQDFVVKGLSNLRELIQTDVVRARAELLRHVSEIRLTPTKSGAGLEYVATGNWDLLGEERGLGRARHLPGVRARMVAGVGFEPTTFGL